MKRGTKTMGTRKSARWSDGIAIIGMSGRFPGADTLAQYWTNLRDGAESISYYSAQELAASGLDPAALDHPNFVNAGSILKDIDMFDAGFFGFTPREAESLDPQKRLFLECAWQALEEAGYDPSRYDGPIGAYAGCAMSSYLYQLERNQELIDLLGVIQILIGNDKDYLTTLVSYKLDLKGPSLSIQTTCSTSLVAVCVACQALLNEECDMALAGGVCVRVPQKTGYYHEPGGIYSPDGHCRVFDSKAGGVVFGNGVGVVVLKRLADALDDRDDIHAVIRGAAINNDGARKASYAAPGVDGQAEVIAKAQRMAGVQPLDISYIEAHGTGTPVGDPIEIAALSKVFGDGAGRRNFCAVGSVKTNFGHLDHAAGIAGLIKTVLCLKNKTLVPSLHFETANPSIDFANSPFYVSTRAADWQPATLPRRAGVSAFGIGGTNAHVILEEAPPSKTKKSSRPAQLLLMSAKSRTALDNATAALGEELEKNPKLNLADVAYTLQVGRKACRYRRVLVARNTEEAALTLKTGGPQKIYTGEASATARSVYFMFSGQGSQYVNMAADLLRVEPTFRKQFMTCAGLLSSRFGLDLERAIYASALETETAAQLLKQTSITQPALFTIEYALARLWQEWGLHPKGMIGHSIGEYVAACLSGVLSLEDALMLVFERGRMMQELPAGSMLAIPLPEDEARHLLCEQLSVAAVNESSMCVVSGPTGEIEQLIADLAAKGIDSRRLHTSHAFHSSMMDPILDQFGERVAGLTLKAPQLPFISNLTGNWMTAAQATDPAYWVQHLRGTVRFADGLSTLLNDSNAVLLEVGPGQTLSSFVRRHSARAGTQVVLSSLRHPHEAENDGEFILTTLGQLWLAGVEIDWEKVHAHERRRRVHLPTYCFDRQKYWAEASNSNGDNGSALGKRPDMSDWFYTPSWKYTVAPEPLKPLESSEQATTEDSNWLIFADNHLGPALLKILKAQGKTVIKVRPANAFAQPGADAYEINHTEPSHYAELFRRLSERHLFPAHIAHLWGVSSDAATDSESALLNRQQDLGLYSVLFAAQAITALDASASIDFAIVTSGLHMVTGPEKISPGKATVLGACKALPQEYPSLRCRSIDVVMPEAAETAALDRLASQLLTEIVTDSADTVVAYRDGHRWVQFFEQVGLTESAESIPLLREGGVYLITGGLGNIGLALAEELARCMFTRIVLLGRAGLPPRREWSNWLLNRADDDPTCHRIRKVQAIESLGSEVLVVSADVADEAALTSAVERIVAIYGDIHGVIHAAGTIAPDTFAPIGQTDRALCERHFAPKIRGILTLEKVLREKPLDFWLMVSSLSSVLAGIGFTGYAAANIFLDAFAAAHNWADGSPWISVNWDAWESQDEADHSSEVPSAASITAREGVETFRRILAWGSLQQVVISASDLQRRIEQWITPRNFMQVTQTHKRSSGALHARPNMLGPYVAPGNQLEQGIADIWQEVLGVDQIGVHDNFFTELNGSSLLATQLVARLRSRFKTDLPLQQFFKAPTIAQIALAMQSNGAGAAQGATPQYSAVVV
jgi:acyl transferase domain-containing protein/acyl carrier protein